MKLLRAILLFVMIITLSSCSFQEKTKTLKVDSQDLKSTIITTNLEEKLEDDKNTVYCSTFQLAWNELMDNIIKGPVKLKDSPNVTEVLNKQLITRKDLNEKDYVAMAGYGKDGILNKINKVLKMKFGESAPNVQEDLVPTDILAYAYLCKNLEFEEEFAKMEKPLLFNGTEVKAFGVNKKSESEVRKQVKVLDYRNDDDFIISLVSKSDNDEIILAKMPQPENVMKAAEIIEFRSSKIQSSVKVDEEVIIPCFDFDITHSYRELVGKQLANAGFEDYQILKAIQSIKFQLDEKGAILKSEARIKGSKSASPVERRSFIFDEPFVLMLKEKNSSMPYFMMWITNDELMVKCVMKIH